MEKKYIEQIKNLILFHLRTSLIKVVVGKLKHLKSTTNVLGFTPFLLAVTVFKTKVKRIFTFERVV